MKTVEELLELAKTAINTNGEVGVGNFLSYSVENDEVRLHDDYSYAKLYAEKGGQVLVIDKQKVYTYKVKSEEEYERYVANQVRAERYEMMNRYGL